MKKSWLYFFNQNITKIFSLKCDIYYAFTFQRLKILFKMQVTFICLKGRCLIFLLAIYQLFIKYFNIKWI